MRVVGLVANKWDEGDSYVWMTNAKSNAHECQRDKWSLADLILSLPWQLYGRILTIYGHHFDGMIQEWPSRNRPIQVSPTMLDGTVTGPYHGCPYNRIYSHGVHPYLHLEARASRSVSHWSCVRPQLGELHWGGGSCHKKLSSPEKMALAILKTSLILKAHPLCLSGCLAMRHLWRAHYKTSQLPVTSSDKDFKLKDFDFLRTRCNKTSPKRFIAKVA